MHKALTVIASDGSLMHLPVQSIVADAALSGPDFPAGFDAGFDEGFARAASGSGYSLITFSSPIPTTLTLDRIDRICWLHRARFASDTLSLEWLNDSLARIVVNLQSLEAL